MSPPGAATRPGAALPIPGCVLAVGPQGHPGFADAAARDVTDALMAAHQAALTTLTHPKEN